MLVNMLFDRMRKGEELKTPRHASAAATRDDRLPYSRQSLIKNQIQELINLASLKPPYKPLTSKQVFKVKKGKDSEVLHYKARQVIKGYLQQYNIDYNQTFAIIVKPIAFRALFAITAYYNLKIKQIDIKTAFLYIVVCKSVAKIKLSEPRTYKIDFW